MITNLVKHAIAPAFLVVIPALVATALAHDDMDPRHIAMTTLGENMKAISRGLKAGEITAVMQNQGAEINGIAEKLTALFPKGQQKEGSRARPEIWTDFAGFQKANRNFVMTANLLNKTLKANDVSAAGVAQKDVGKSCGGCHKAYRLPKK